MLAGRTFARISWTARPTDHLVAALLALVAISARAAINAAVPGIACFSW